jgi:Type I phosphodiesterase / nucleotide pyrophosphatase
MTTQTIEPTLPKYAQSSLDALGTSILAAVGVPDEPNPLMLPPAERVCLLVVDGLGWELLRAHPAAAPFLSELAMNAAPLTAGFPATTATSLASLGTGRPPGQHGILGYQVAVPGAVPPKLLNMLRWDSSVDPLTWQPGPTCYERAAAAGVFGYRVGPIEHGRTGLSVATMRGVTYLPGETLGALVGLAASSLANEEHRVFTTVYYGDLDTTGHLLGCTSDAWLYQLAHVDKLAEQLVSALPHGTLLLVTADHGMVDITEADRIDADSVPGLRDGVELLGGEARVRHVYGTDGAAADVLAAWREVLGDRAWVVSREQAVAEGWFGPVLDENLARIGDVIAACCGPSAVIATRTEPRESKMVGMHGSLTQAEQLVPLLTFTTG